MINLKKAVFQNKHLLNISQFLGARAVNPLFIVVYTTIDCNCRCTGCFQIGENFFSARNMKLSLEDFQKILSSAGKFPVKPLIHFSGGEPLLNEHFGDFLSLAKKSGFKCSIVTNGYLLDRYARAIFQSSLQAINVSIDGLAAEHDERRKIPGMFDKVVANLELLTSHQGSRRPAITVNCVISRLNFGKLADFADFFKRKFGGKIAAISFQHLMFDQTDPEYAKGIDCAELARQIKKIKSAEYPFSVYFNPDIKEKDLDRYYKDYDFGFKTNCNIPWLGLIVFPNLDVAPGGGVFDCKRIVGDLKNSELKDIWNNTALKEFRQKILKGGVSRACYRCCHRQYY